MNNSSDKNTREEIAQRGFQDFSRNRTVLLAFKEDFGRAKEIASGTLVKTPGGKLCVLTVKHIFDDWFLELSENSSNLAILTNNGLLPEDCIYGYIRHPNLDVMLIVISSEISISIQNPSLPSQLINLDFKEVLKDDCFFLTGFPVDLRTTYSREKIQEFPYLTVPYGAEDIKTNEDRLILDWKVVERVNISILKNLQGPHGLSGSPVWKCRAADKNKFWSYDEITRLIGIQESWKSKTKEIFVVPLEKWKTWLFESLERIDGQA